MGGDYQLESLRSSREEYIHVRNKEDAQIRKGGHSGFYVHHLANQLRIRYKVSPTKLKVQCVKNSPTQLLTFQIIITDLKAVARPGRYEAKAYTCSAECGQELISRRFGLPQLEASRAGERLTNAQTNECWKNVESCKIGTKKAETRSGKVEKVRHTESDDDSDELKEERGERFEDQATRVEACADEGFSEEETDCAWMIVAFV